MTTIERIHQQLTRLPETLHPEVLDFVEYLIAKTQREAARREFDDWSSFSLGLAMRGMEDEDAPIYNLEDLRERF
jgi:hypothetical protein